MDRMERTVKLLKIVEALEEVQDYLVDARNLLKTLTFRARELNEEHLYSYLTSLLADLEVLIDNEHNYLGNYNNVQEAIEIVNEILEGEEDNGEED